MKEIYAEMAGTVFQLLVNEGEQIEEGQVTVVFRIDENGNSS